MGSIEVVSWNVLAEAYVRAALYPRTPASVLDPVRRRAAVVERAASFRDADVVCLQEVEADVFERVSARLAGFSGRLLLKRGRSEGCAILVRGAAVAWRELVYGDASGHVAIAATLADGTHVACTHLKWSPPETPLAEHHGYRELRELLDAWARPGAGPLVVTGDFNVEPQSDAIGLAIERGMRDAYASLPEASTCVSDGRKKRIDFVLTTGDLECAPRPLRALADDTPLPSDEEPSDHLPIRARVSPRAP